MDCTSVTNHPTSLSCIPVFINNILIGLIPISAAAAIFFIIFAGLKFLTSNGDPVKVENAKKTLTFAVIGLTIVLLSFVIFKVFATVTNTKCEILGVGC